MTRLRELAPELIAFAGENGWTEVAGENPSQADGLMFICPKCYERLGGMAGAHSVIVWFRGRGVPDSARPGPGRWNVHGTSFDDLTLDPSVHLQAGCGWHGWVRHGEIT